MVDSLVDDEVAVITGSGRGIGRGIAMEMAAEGAKVVIVAPGVNVDGSGWTDALRPSILTSAIQVWSPLSHMY